MHRNISLLLFPLLAVFLMTPIGFAQQAPQVTFSHALAPESSPQPTSALRDTVRILAVMVDFQEDSDTRTTGTGKFGTTFKYDYGKRILDPLPHDRAHFENHLTFLKNYIWKVSGGKTTIVDSVLPDIVTLPKNMQSYAPRKNENNKVVLDLAIDAWKGAETKFSSLEFSQYDFFIVFHAGVGRDVNLASIQGYNPAPYDIPSLYIGLQSMISLDPNVSKGIPVRNGFYITNTAVVPSTESREIPSLLGGETLLNLTINGLLAAMFGNFAGLPDLFDTKTGNTAISRYGLMDGQSIFAYGGICPPQPNAWEKQFLGWATATDAEPGKKNYFLLAHRTDQLTTANIIRIPITSREYWLLENRQRDPAGNGQEVTFLSEGQIVTQRFPKDTTGFSTSDLSALRGVVIDVEDVDWSLPGGVVIVDGAKQVKVGGGFLLWHIDEDVVRGNLATNTVNADKNHRGVDLEQASGIQDIGETIQSPLGNYVGEGSPLDYWFRGNISPLYKNSFSKTTFPSSLTNGEYDSHVTIGNFSDQGSFMTCDITLGDNTITPMPGFPVKLFEPSITKNEWRLIQTSDLENDGDEEIIVVRGTNTLLRTRKAEGTVQPLSEVSSDMYIVHQDATGFIFPKPDIPCATKLNFPSGIITADVDGDRRKEIIISSDKPTVLASRDQNTDGFLDSVYQYPIPSGQPLGLSNGFLFITQGDSLFEFRNSTRTIRKLTNITASSERLGLALYGDEKYCVTFNIGSSAFEVIDIAQAAISKIELPSVLKPQAYSLSQIVVGTLQASNKLTIVGAFGNQLFAITADGVLAGFPATVRSESVQLALADVNGDQQNEIVVTGQNGIEVFNYAGALIDHYPVEGYKTVLAARLSNSNAVSLFGVGGNAMNIFNAQGTSLDGFPIKTASNPEAVLFEVGKTGKTLGLALIGDDGFLYAYDLKIPVNNRTLVWRSKYHDERNTNFLAEDVAGGIPFSQFFPEERCYNWPNPVYNASTKIRYYVSKDANISVKVYDLAGEKVDELHAKAVGGTDNEIDWNVSDIQSGIYLCRVEATSGGESGMKIIKIAVIK